MSEMSSSASDCVNGYLDSVMGGKQSLLVEHVEMRKQKFWVLHLNICILHSFCFLHSKAREIIIIRKIVIEIKCEAIAN